MCNMRVLPHKETRLLGLQLFGVRDVGQKVGHKPVITNNRYMYLNPLSDVCVKYESNLPMDFRNMPRKQNC